MTRKATKVKIRKATKIKVPDRHEVVAGALCRAINAAEGADEQALARRLSVELAQFAYDHLNNEVYTAICKKCGWEWDESSSPCKDIAARLGITTAAVCQWMVR